MLANTHWSPKPHQTCARSVFINLLALLTAYRTAADASFINSVARSPVPITADSQSPISRSSYPQNSLMQQETLLGSLRKPWAL